MRTNVCSLLLVTTVALAPSIGLAQPPLCDADGPYTGYVGDPVQFDGTRSMGIPPHEIIVYQWQFGDGGTGSGPTPTHIYAAPELYFVTLVVIDDEGAHSEPCQTSALITIPSAVEPRTWGLIKAIYR